MSHGLTVERWTAKRQVTVVIGIFKGKPTVAEVAREHDLTDSEGCAEVAQRNIENAFRARPRDLESSVNPS